MKKIITLFLGLIVTIGFAQNAPIDFEPGGHGADWTWTVFENETNPPLEIIDNPDPTGINTSATVAKFTAMPGGQPWAGVESDEGYLGEFYWDENNTIIKIMVWKSVISNVGIKFDTGAHPNDWSSGDIQVANTVTNQWEELTFDFSNAPNPPAEFGGLKRIIIFPDFDDRDQENVAYFDNITFNPVGDTPSNGPDVAAPTPPALDPNQVISIFSDAFTDVEGTDFNPNWGQTTQVSIVEIEGNETLKYANFNYQGTQFAEALNVSEMEYLHLDMWTADATSVNVFCISADGVETPFALPITPNQWVSYDIPLSEFTNVNMNELIQFKFDGGDGSQTIYLDNLYFFTEEGEEGTDATLSDLQIDGTTVDGFSPSVLHYSVVLPEGTTEVPTVTATTNDPDASADITPADGIPGTTSILVTSANTEVELTYTVAFTLDTGDVEGPKNPIDFEPDGYGADWTWTVFENETNPPLEIIDNPDPSGINTSATVAKFTALQEGNPWAGVESEQGVDLGTFEWDDSNRIVKIQVWKSVISDVGIKFATETGWAEEELKVANTLTNEWEELTFDFSDFINPPDGNGTLGQIIIFPDFAERDQDNVVYFDNITFGPVGDDPPPADGPEVAAPTPPARDPEDVVSIFSHAYDNVEGTDFNPNWGQTTQVSIVEIEGNETLKYANFNYQGTQFAEALNVSEMEYLHLDMWTADATSVNIFCISTGPVETAFALQITPNQWVSYDIPLSEFTNVDMTDVIQFKFDGGDGTPTIYLDNLYFFKAPPTSVSSFEQNALSIYPNPARLGGQVHLSKVVDQINVYDLTGKLVISSNNTSTLDIAELNVGFFMLRIHDGDGETHVKKLIVR